MKILFIFGLLLSLSVTAYIIFSSRDKPVVQGIETIVNPSPTLTAKPINTSSKEMAIQTCTSRVKEKIEILKDLSTENAITGINLVFRFCLTEHGQEPFDLVTSEATTSESYINNPQPTLIDYSLDRKQKCNQEMTEYNTCLSEKTAAESQYNTCMNEKITNPYKICIKGYNATKTCFKPLCL